MARHICPGCGQHLDDDALVWPVPDVGEKVLPGEMMPAGECPDCGSLVSAADALRDAFSMEVDERDENFER